MALGAALGVLGLVAAAAGVAWVDAAPLEPGRGGRLAGDDTYAWSFLSLLALALAAYLGGLWALARRRARRAGVVALAVAVQLAPLGGPLLLSSDVYAYWVYGELARAGDNPYRAPPSERRELAGHEWMGSDWTGQTTVYGPAFTAASAAVVAERPRSAELAFRIAAAAAMVAAVLVVARRSAFAAAFVGWNPLLAIHAAGGGHNDAWLAALLVVALALSERGRRDSAGATWALAVFVKWMPLVLLPLHALAERARGRRLGIAGFAAAATGLAVAATWWFGRDWVAAFLPLAENAERTTSFALPRRLAGAGVPLPAAIGLFAAAFVAAFAWLVREALRGRARLALAAGLLVACSPYVTPWYLAWVVPLAALEDDRVARALALGLTAYLLPQTIPV